MKGGRTSTIDPQLARDAVKRHLIRLKTAVNGVQLRAQTHEIEMVDILAGFARDPELPPSLRRTCAIDVVTLARGVPKAWLHDSQDIDPKAEGSSGLGATIGQEIDAARLTATLHEQLADLTARNIHPSKWPEDVRSVAADMVAYYENDDVIPPTRG